MTTARLREGLNVESGLNDGICVPIVLFFVALAGSGGHGDGSASALALVVQEIGIGMAFHLFSWQVVLYALLSLTVIRVVPIFLSLTGTGESVPSKLFLGWFGPPGLASIVFAIIVINAEVPGAEFLALVVTTTVLLSLVAHGMSASPLAKWIGRKDQQDA